jgi:hypothetical protein
MCISEHFHKVIVILPSNCCGDSSSISYICQRKERIFRADAAVPWCFNVLPSEFPRGVCQQLGVLVEVVMSIVV